MSVIDTILNSIKTLWAFVKALPNAINTVITWVDGLWNDAATDVNNLYNYIVASIKSDLAYAFSVYVTLLAYVGNTVTSIYKWTTSELSSLESWALGLINQVIGYLQTLENWATAQFASLITWINTEIIQPIWTAIETAANWIEVYGAFVVNLLTHPELLAQLLGKYILSTWISLGRQFAKPFFSWFLANALSLIPDFEGILEDIISSLFD